MPTWRPFRAKGVAGYYHTTNYNFPPDWVEYYKADSPATRSREHSWLESLLEGRTVQVADVLAEPEYAYREQQKKAGYRNFLAVPLLREGQPIGVLSFCRKTVRPFSNNQIDLVSTFADQAVIAIENVRLFDEVKGAHVYFWESAPAADRDRRCAQGHQPFGVRFADGAANARRMGSASVRGRQGHHYPPKGRCVLSCRMIRLF